MSKFTKAVVGMNKGPYTLSLQVPALMSARHFLFTAARCSVRCYSVECEDASWDSQKNSIRPLDG